MCGDTPGAPLRGNRDDNLLAIYVSGAEDPKLVLCELQYIHQLQHSFGGDKVLYFHRRTNWGKKWGAYQDLMVWLWTGRAHPIAYLSEKYGSYKRELMQQFFSLNLVDGLGAGTTLSPKEIETGIVGDITKLQADDLGIEYLLISDADVVWPPEAAIRIVEKMAHKANSKFAIFQPSVTIRNIHASLYTKVLTWSRQLSEFASLAIWRIYDTYTFYGKGGINIREYLKVMLGKDEEILPPSALSHDFIEARYLQTAYLPDVQILENAPKNYFEDLKRLQRWTIGDLIGIWHETIKPIISKLAGPFGLSTKSHSKPQPLGIAGNLITRLIIKFEFSSTVFALFLLLTMIGGSLPGIYLLANPTTEIALMCFVLIGIVILPRTIAPIAAHVHLRGYNSRPLLASLIPVLAELVLSTLLFLQQLADRNIAILKALVAIWRAKKTGKGLKWETSSEQCMQLKDISYWTIYRKRVGIVSLGLVLPLLLFFTQPLITVWYASPIWLSFLLGPGLSKLTAGGK